MHQSIAPCFVNVLSWDTGCPVLALAAVVSELLLVSVPSDHPSQWHWSTVMTQSWLCSLGEVNLGCHHSSCTSVHNWRPHIWLPVSALLLQDCTSAVIPQLGPHEDPSVSHGSSVAGHHRRCSSFIFLQFSFVVSACCLLTSLYFSPRMMDLCVASVL